MRKHQILLIVIICASVSGCIIEDISKKLKEPSAWNKIGGEYTWRNSGVRDYKTAYEWHNIGVYHTAVSYWKKAGIQTPQKAKKWIDKGFDIGSSGKGEKVIKGYINAGVIDANDALRWENLGVPYYYVNKWGEIGVSSKTAKKWGQYFDISFNQYGDYTYNQAFAFISAKIVLTEAKLWKKAGVTFHNINRWTKVGLSRPETLLKWINAGYKNDDIFEYLKAGFKTSEEVNEWNKIEKNISTQLTWKKIGKTPNDAYSWIKAGVPNGYDWIEKGVSSPQKAKNWKNMGVQPELIPGLSASGIKSASKLKKTCSKVIYQDAFSSSSPYKHINKCIAACVKVNQVLSSNKIFGYILDKRAVFAVASKKLRDDFVVDDNACGVYKVKKANKIELLLGRSIMGNSLSRISKI